MADKIKVELDGVPGTLLWNLYHRAAAARRPDALLTDPRAVELVEAIDFPFERFGEPRTAQVHALRVLTFDAAVLRFLNAHPGGTVVALGEGLETEFWRVDNGRVRWLTVDLPETVEVRRRLLPDDPPRRRSLARSARRCWTSARGSRWSWRRTRMPCCSTRGRGMARRPMPAGALSFRTFARWAWIAST